VRIQNPIINFIYYNLNISYWMGKKERSQVSLEYMIIVGFSLLLIMPVLVIYSMHKQDISDEISYNQARDIARMIADGAETVYFIGEKSCTTVRVSMPSNIESIGLSGNEVIIGLRQKSTIVEAVAYSSVNVTGNVTARPGLQDIQVVSGPKGVVIASGSSSGGGGCGAALSSCTPELCSNFLDDDCDGDSDYDSSDGRHGDNDCPVEITSMTVPITTILANNDFNAQCVANVADVNSVTATVNALDCTYTSCSDTQINFSCIDVNSNTIRLSYLVPAGFFPSGTCSFIPWGILADSIREMHCSFDSCIGETAAKLQCLNTTGGTYDVIVWDLPGSCSSLDQDSVVASMGDECTLSTWSGNTANFVCNAGALGKKAAVCYVMQSKSYQTGMNHLKVVEVLDSICGDGSVDGAEECDDGALNSDSAPDACRTDCKSAACGDGIIDTGEECDDGDSNPGDGCSNTCNIESGYGCTGEPSICTSLVPVTRTCTSCAACQAQINIANPGDTIKLTSDMSKSPPGGFCLWVSGKDDLIIDCDGHTISGSATTSTARGIYVGHSPNAEVKNCVITGFDFQVGVFNDFSRGLYVRDSNGLNVHDITANNNVEGVEIYGCDDSSFEDITTLNNNQNGIKIYWSDNLNFNRITSKDNGFFEPGGGFAGGGMGMYFQGSDSNTLTNLRICGNDNPHRQMLFTGGSFFNTIDGVPQWDWIGCIASY